MTETAGGDGEVVRPPLLVRSRRLLKLRQIRRIERRTETRVVYGNHIEVLAGGEAAFEAMVEAVRGARHSLAIEMYHWADDRLGRRFAEEVRAKARAGLPVYVVVDAFGSIYSAALMASLEAAGALLRWYHPLAPWTRAWSPNHRDHRKVLLIDGTLGFAGGFNLAEVYSEEFLGAAAWKDLAVRVEGPAVREMTRLFLGSWLRVGGKPEAAGELFVAQREAGASGVQVLGGAGLLGRRRLRKSYLTLIGTARERIFLANAYFAPEWFLRRALCRAARRGTRVDMLLSGPTDAPMVRWAGRASYEPLLEAGVRVREMAHAVLHAKIAVFDDEVLLSGSANLDYRSFRHNLEISVKVFDHGASRRALDYLGAEFGRSKEITLEDWKRRPPTEKLLERFASLWRYWL